MSEPSPQAAETLTLNEAYARAQVAARDGRAAEAERLYRAILAGRAIPQVAANFGAFLESQDRPGEAEQIYRAALESAPDDPLVRRRLAVLLLRAGAYEEGWALHEARFAGSDWRKPTLSFPEWDGRAIHSLLVMPDPSGLADQILLARYAALLSARGGKISLACDPLLLRLFDALGLVLMADRGEIEIPQHDAWTLAGSLPRLMQTRLENIPAKPYLPRRVGGAGVGVMLRPEPAHGDLAAAAPPPELAAEIASLAGAVSLHPADSGARDLADVAEAIDKVALVIAIDSAVAHLAGAMGKPCWLLLADRAHWRWLEGRDDSPWYPSMRLFRQPAGGDWSAVAAAVGKALAERAG